MQLPCKLIFQELFVETETTEMNYNRKKGLNTTTTASNDVAMATRETVTRTKINEQ